MATETIRIVMSLSGDRAAAEGIKRVGGAATSSASGVHILRQALGLLGITAITREIVGLSDSFIGLRNRIRTVTDDFTETNVVMRELFDISSRTRSDFDATAETYARLAASAKTLGFSQFQLLQVTESINQAIILSGANAREATFALIQLSQAFARGQLRGDELRAILEELPKVADVIAKHLGVTRFELSRLGEQGKISGKDIALAFLEAQEELDQAFAKTVPTIGQAFVVLRNKLVQQVGAFNDATNASVLLAEGVIFLSNHLLTLIRIVAGLSTVFLVNLVARAIPAVISAFGSLGVSAAAALGPVGAILVTIGGLLVVFSDQIQVAGVEGGTLADVLAASFGFFLGTLEGVVDFFGTVADSFITVWDAFTRPAADATAQVEKLGDAGERAFSFLEKIPFIGKGIAESKRAIQQLAQARADARAQEQFTRKRQEDQARERLKAQVAAVPRPTTTEEKFEEEIKRLQRLQETLKVTGSVNEAVEEQIRRIANKLKVDLTPAQEERVRKLVEENIALKDQQSILDNLRGPVEDLTRKQAALTVLLESGKISLEEYNREMLKLRQNVVAVGTDFKSGISQGLLQVQEQFTNLAELSRNTLVDAFQGAEDALVKFVQTGKLNFGDLVDTIVADLTRLAVRQAIIAPLASSLGLTGAGAAGQQGGILSSLFGNLFGGGAGGGGGNIFSFLGGLFGFGGAQNGADFTVPGPGGVDSRLVTFKATPGERVQVSTPSQRGEMQPVQVINNFHLPNVRDAHDFQRSSGQIAADMERSLARARARNS